MEVKLSFGSRQQVDKGGRLGSAIEKAAVLLAVESLPKEVTKLSREEALEEGLLDEEDQEDDDDEDDADADDDDEDEDEEADDGSNIWVIAIGETNVYFAQPTPDLKARLIIRAV
jgi:hypothetical protein